MLFGIRAGGAPDSVVFRKRSHLLATTALVLAVFSALPPGGVGKALADDSEYLDLGTLGGTKSDALGISADGSVVIGYSNPTGSNNFHAFRWTSGGSMVELVNTLNGPNSYAYAVNADGSVVVGQAETPGNGARAVRWNANGTMDNLGTLGGTNSQANAVSADGSIVVGWSNVNGGGDHAFRWVEGGLIEDITTTIGTLGGSVSRANGISADGSVIVGYAETPGQGGRAVRWTSAGIDSLDTLGGTNSEAKGVSEDGSVIVGWSNMNGGLGDRAFRWTASDDTMVSIGVIGSDTISRANAVSADGSVVVGYSGLNNNNRRAFRWTDATGMVSVEDWLRNNGVTVASDFTKEAKGVSDDGSVVVGTTSSNTAFIARVAAPTSPGGGNPGNGNPGGGNPGGGNPGGGNPGNGNPGNGNSGNGNSGGGSGIIDVEQYSRTLAIKPSAQIGIDYAHTALNGVHGEPMRTLLDAGRQSFSVTADSGYDNGDFAEGGLAIGDIAYGIGLEGGATARIAFGGLYTKQDLDSGGDFSQKGFYLAPEVSLPIGSGLYATIGGYYAPGKLDIDRGYLNGGLPDSSRGETDIDTWAAKLRIDWLNAASFGETKLTPYASLTYAHARMDGYTETGGSFPSAFDAVSDHATVARIGLDSVTDLTDHIRLLGKAEAAYRFETETADVTGRIVGLSGFNLGGRDIDQFWLRGAIGTEFDAGGGTASLSVNASTEGDDPSVWLKSGWRVTF